MTVSCIHGRPTNKGRTTIRTPRPKPSRQEPFSKHQLLRCPYGTRTRSHTPWDRPRKSPHESAVTQMSSTDLTRYQRHRPSRPPPLGQWFELPRPRGFCWRRKWMKKTKTTNKKEGREEETEREKKRTWDANEKT